MADQGRDSVVGLSIFATRPARPEIVTCPECDGSGEFRDSLAPGETA